MTEAGPNALDPCLMTSAERLDEVARLLHTAVLRRRKRRKKGAEIFRNGLELGANVSPHGTGEVESLIGECACNRAR